VGVHMSDLRANSISSRRLLSVIFVALAAAGMIRAQDATVLSGAVTDPNGQAVPATTITVTNTATGSKRETQTGADGTYVFTQMVPGTYQIRVEAKGFKSAVHDNVQVLIQTPRRVDFKLEVGEVKETITVSASAGETELNTQDATMGNTFTTKQITQLPLEGRNATALLSLQPGVVYIGERFTSDIRNRNGSVNGSRNDQANITLDGIDVNDQQNATPFSGALRATTDSVQEFRVTTTRFCV
jgi:protocatechuate 3,4-dioxygenase beta subunit